MIFLPYTTADFHTGAKTKTYRRKDEKITLQYFGRINTEKILDWVFDKYPIAEKVIVSGSSAGGFGSTFWTGHVAEQYKNSKIYSRFFQF